MYWTNVKVYFYDADPAGIIFYASLFKYTHSAYEDFLKNLNTERDYFFDTEFVLPIVHAEADYLLPIKVSDVLKVNVWVSQLKKHSFELSYKFHRSEHDVVATAKTVHVCVAKINFGKAELPKDVYEKLKTHLP